MYQPESGGLDREGNPGAGLGRGDVRPEGKGEQTRPRRESRVTPPDSFCESRDLCSSVRTRMDVCEGPRRTDPLSSQSGRVSQSKTTSVSPFVLFHGHCWRLKGESLDPRDRVSERRRVSVGSDPTRHVPSHRAPRR